VQNVPHSLTVSFSQNIVRRNKGEFVKTLVRMLSGGRDRRAAAPFAVFERWESMLDTLRGFGFEAWSKGRPLQGTTVTAGCIVPTLRKSRRVGQPFTYLRLRGLLRFRSAVQGCHCGAMLSISTVIPSILCPNHRTMTVGGSAGSNALDNL
jgi:hypothetical protein